MDDWDYLKVMCAIFKWFDRWKVYIQSIGLRAEIELKNSIKIIIIILEQIEWKKPP